jgi:hypothetical protein
LRWPLKTIKTLYDTIIIQSTFCIYITVGGAIMDLDEKLCDVLVNKITEVHNALSSEARKHISTKHEIENYQETIKSRFYCESYDEDDYDLLELLKVLIQCYLNEQ